MCSRRFGALSPALALVAAAACGGNLDSGGADGGEGRDGATDGALVSIDVEPDDQTLVIDGDSPATAEYSATATYEDSTERDVTSEVRFSVRDTSLGRVEGSSFESFTTRGGVTRVTARLDGVAGSARVELVLKKRRADPGSEDDLPDDPGQAFEGDEDEARAPQLVYPNDGAMVPPNLKKLEFHFLPGEGNDLFELRFQNELTDISLYLRCTEQVGEGCVYEPDETLWNWLAQTNRGADAIEVTLRGTDDEGGPVGTSEPIDLRVSFDDVRGAIYYWTTSGDTAIMRYDFGDHDQDEAEVFIEGRQDLTDGKCVGCHVLSPEGDKMVAELNGQDDGSLLLYDVEEEEPLQPITEGAQSIFESWSPDASEFVGVYMDSGATDYNLLLFDGETAEKTGSIDVDATADEPANHPDWSPDGDKIAFTRVGEPTTNQKSNHAEIHMITREGDGWSDSETLVPREEGTNYYYPAFAPDSQSIIFNRSRCNDGNTGAECDQDMDPTAVLMMMEAEAGAEPVELARANAPGIMDEGETALTNSFPKWSPFEFQRTEEFGSRLMWVTFSSKRRYGLRDTDTLLWMAAIDPDRVRSGNDPSFPAFAVPYQDIDTENHIAQWTVSSVVIE